MVTRMMGLRPLCRLLGLLLVLVAAAGGCTSEGAIRKTTRGAVFGTAEGLAGLDPQLLAKLRRTYLSDLGIQDAARDLTASLVVGAADGLRQAQIDKLARETVSATMRALREEGVGAVQDLAQSLPQLETALQVAVTRLILSSGAALRQSATQDLSVATRALVHAAVEESLTTVVAYARNLDAETRRYASETLAPSAGLVLRAMTREAVLGAEEGLTQASHGKQLPLRAVMREIGAGLAEGMKEGVTDNGALRTVLIAMLVVMSALLVGSLAAAYALWRRYRRTTASLIMFAKRINESQKINQEYSQALRDSIYKSHAETKQDTWLRDFLAHRGL